MKDKENEEREVAGREGEREEEREDIHDTYMHERYACMMDETYMHIMCTCMSHVLRSMLLHYMAQLSLNILPAPYVLVIQHCMLLGAISS